VSALQAIEKQRGVRSAEFIPLVRFFSTDPLFNSQWGFPICHVPQAWGLVSGGAKVGVLDTGVDLNHPDLSVDPASDPPTGAGMGNSGHGTCVAGIVGATINNGLGVAGVAPCPLIVRACIAVDQVAPMLGVVAQAGAKVANLSFGEWILNPQLETALNHDVDSVIAATDLLVCAASGNGGSGSVIAWPARNASVMAIGAILPNGVRWACSDYDQSELDLVAPGGCGLVTTDLLGSETPTWMSSAVAPVRPPAASGELPHRVPSPPESLRSSAAPTRR
jgi:subtilisin family serine protease